MKDDVRVLTAIIIAAAVIITGFVAVWIGAKFTFDPNASSLLLARLQSMGLLTIVIERAVEVYLGVSQQNGEDRHDSNADPKATDAKQPASIAALALGVLAAICGVRVLDALGSLDAGAGQWAKAIWSGVDIVLSGGLLAGGAFVMHEVTELITGTLRRVDPSKPATPATARPAATASDATLSALALALAPSGAGKGQPVIDRCEAAFDANKNDCNAFVRAVAAASGVTLTGQADDIVDQILGTGWTTLAGGVQAAAMADAGMLVVAGLKSGEHNPARTHGHVAIVVSGPLASGKYPTGYWGSSGAASGRNQTMNYSWNAADRDNVHYAFRSI